MTEYRVPPRTSFSRREDQRIRLALWGAVFLLVIITVFAVLGARKASSELNTALAVTAVVIVMGTVGSAYLLSWRNAVECAKRNVVVLLTEKELIAKRVGWPDVRIALSEIKTLHEQRERLVVEGTERGRFIAIPNDVVGYDNLRAELIKHGEISKVPKRSTVTIASAAAGILCLVCWSLVLLAKHVAVVATAGAFALSLSGWYSFRIAKLVKQSPKRFLVWLVLATSWLGALWVAYQRISKH